MGIIQVAEKMVLPRWSLEQWERTFVALECDMLKGKAAKNMLLKPGPAEEFGDGGGSTSAGLVSLEDRSFRSCLQNALVISTMFLQDPMNRRRLQIIVGLGRHIRAWHGDQNQQLRGNEAALAWIKAQVGKKEFFITCNNIIQSLACDGFLGGGEFCLPVHPKVVDSNNRMVEDDEIAAAAGKLAVAFALARLRTETEHTYRGHYSRVRISFGFFNIMQ